VIEIVNYEGEAMILQSIAEFEITYRK
jgi:hypothetical protein